MPRYHFDVHDGSDFYDADGVVLPDLAAARQHALQYSGELLKGSGSEFWDGSDWSMNVKDEEGLILFTLHFMAVDAPSIAGRSPSAAGSVK